MTSENMIIIHAALIPSTKIFLSLVQCTQLFIAGLSLINLVLAG